MEHLNKQPKRTKRKYTLEFKRQAIALARKEGAVPPAAKKLGIDQSNLYYWIRAKKVGRLTLNAKEGVRKKSNSAVAVRRRYSTSFKLEVVEEVTKAKSSSVVEIARRHKLPSQTLFNWVKDFRDGRFDITIKLNHEEISCLRESQLRRQTELKARRAVLHDNERKELRVIRALLKKFTL